MTTGRDYVHDASAPHAECKEPGRCPCDCVGCKRTWFIMGRPGPRVEAPILISEKQAVELVARVQEHRSRRDLTREEISDIVRVVLRTVG